MFQWVLSFMVLLLLSGCSKSYMQIFDTEAKGCLLYTSDAADERSSVDLGGRRIIKNKTNRDSGRTANTQRNYKETYVRASMS